jgi:carboxylesterase type B
MTTQLYVFNSPGIPTLIMNPCDYQNQAEIWTNIFWKRSAVDNVAQYLIQHQTNVYAYEFLYGAYHYVAGTCRSDPAVFNAWPDFSPSGGANFALWFGAMHMLDIPFFFGNYYFINDMATGLLFRGDNYLGYHSLSTAMMTYVSQFARNGMPGQVDGVPWTPWTGVDGPRILFDANAGEAQIEMSAP